MASVPSTPLSPGTDHPWNKSARWAAPACVILSVVVFVWRGAAALQAHTIAPGVAVTSGFEEESWFALWRTVHDRPVYADASRLPYAAAYFNWLFYASYAGPVGLAVGRWGDAIIPVAGRLVTAIGALAGAAGLFVLLRRMLAGRVWLAAALVSMVFFGSLVSWWAHTVRPDVWALALETSALAVLLLHYRTRPLTAVLAASLLFYGAWSFKQSYVFGLGGAWLFLVWHRQWRLGFLLAVSTVVLWVATFALMGPDYRAAVRSLAANNVFYFAQGWETLRDLVAKSVPLWLLAFGVLFRRGSDTETPLATDAIALGRLGLLVALPLGFAASCKLGAASNYYFTTLVMLALVAGGSNALRPKAWPVAIACGLAAGLQLLALLGHAGKVSLREQTTSLTATWNAWQHEAEPRFSVLTSLNLPWLNKSSPPLVLAFNYGMDRAAGRAFERDGVGGLIAAGYFQSLLLPSDTALTYDGASLGGYVRGETVENLTIFRHKPNSSP